MRPQAYQQPEIRDENDFIIQQGTFGKKTPFVNSQNDGILDYIINNLEAIKGVSLAATIVVSSLPSAGQAGKFYLLDDGTENSGKVYVYKDKWIEVTTQAEGLSAYQVAKKNGYEGTEQEWLENEVYGDDIVSAETDSDGYFIVHTRQGKTIKTTLKPLVDAKVSADKAKISETNAKTYETNSANSAAAALASQKASADSQTKAKTSETNAKASENNSKSSENLAKAWAMSENSPDGVDGNKSSKTWAGEAKASASNSASSASDASTSATSAKQSETNAANSAKAAKQSEENAKTWDPTQYAKIDQTVITTADSFILDNKDYVDINDARLLKKSSIICIYNSTASKIANLPEPNNKRSFFLFNFKDIKSTDDIAGKWLGCAQFFIYISPPVHIFYRRISGNPSQTKPTFLAWKQIVDTDITNALANKIPTKVSQLTNDSNYATKEELETECVDKINELNTALKNGFTTASLTVSGETSVPTPATTNKSKTIANTEFVHGVVNNLVNGAPTALDTLQELASALGNDPNFSTTILNKIGEKESKTDAQIEYKKLQGAIPTKVSQLSNDNGYQKTAEIPVVSQTQNGYMSKSDKAKLDGIEEGATNVTDYVQSVAESNGKVTVTKGGGESTTFNAGLNILARNKAYAVGDIAYSPNLPSYLYLECTTAGITGEAEPDMSTVSGGVTVDDGTAQFAIKTVCAKEYVDAKVNDEGSKWKKAYNNLRKRSYPTAFDEDELTVLMSKSMGSGTITLSQPYTDFDGLLFIVANDNGHRWERIYISTATLQEQIKDCQNDTGNHHSVCLFNGTYYWWIFVDKAHRFSETSFPEDTDNCWIYKIYGVKFKEIA